MRLRPQQPRRAVASSVVVLLRLQVASSVVVQLPQRPGGVSLEPPRHHLRQVAPLALLRHLPLLQHWPRLEPLACE